MFSVSGELKGETTGAEPRTIHYGKENVGLIINLLGI